MKLLEIVRGRETSDTVRRDSRSRSARRIGKVCAVVGNCFGFVANRMLAYYMREAYLLLEEGATVEQIDRVLVDFGMPVGPFAMQDIAGIDVGTRIRQHLAKMGKTRADGPQSEVPDRLFDLGRYGQKTSAGLVPLRAGQPDSGCRSAHQRDCRGRGRSVAASNGATASRTRRSSRVSRRRWPTRERGFSTRDSPVVPATST